jgi:outer membrane protein OmpA-like peptidoglycan-associated protein/Fe-S cluster assembly iron-binding protein IscA
MFLMIQCGQDHSSQAADNQPAKLALTMPDEESEDFQPFSVPLERELRDSLPTATHTTPLQKTAETQSQSEDTDKPNIIITEINVHSTKENIRLDKDQLQKTGVTIRGADNSLYEMTYTAPDSTMRGEVVANPKDIVIQEEHTALFMRRFQRALISGFNQAREDLIFASQIVKTIVADSAAPVFQDIVIDFRPTDSIQVVLEDIEYNTDKEQIILGSPNISTEEEVRKRANDAQQRFESYQADERKMFVQVETKVFFESGKDLLDKENQARLDDIVRDINNDITRYTQENPDDKLIFLLHVRGYADEKPFFPTQAEEQRKLQNQQLSARRAQSIEKYILSRLVNKNIEIEAIIEGLGEELPPRVFPNDEVSDPRRRACAIYFLVCNQDY